MADSVKIDSLFEGAVTSKPKRQTVESGPVKIDSLFEKEAKETSRPIGEAIDQSSILKQAGGFALGNLDLIGSIPGVLAGTARGLYNVAAGEGGDVALQRAKETMHAGNPLNLLPNAEELRKTEGYQYSPGNMIGQLATKTLEGYNQGAQALTHMATGSHQTARDIGGATEIGLMASLPFMRGKPAQAGTPQSYFNVQDMKPSGANLRHAQESQASYATDRIKAAMPPTPEAPFPNYSRSGQLPNVETATQFLERTGREAEMKRAQEAAEGSVRDSIDSQNYLREQLTGTKDMFDPAMQTRADREIASGMSETPTRRGTDIPASEFKAFTKEFHKDPGATERTASLFDQRNPEIFKEPVDTPRGMDFWKSRLDDTVSRTDQIMADRFVQNYDKQITRLTEELKYLSSQLKLAESEGLYTRNGKLRTGKDAEKTIQDLRAAVGDKLGERTRAELALEKRMNSPRWHMREVYPDRAFTGDAPVRGGRAGGKQTGGYIPKDDIGKLFSTDPAKAARELAKRHSNPDSFAKEYGKFTGDEAGGRSLYAWAKQETAKEKGTTVPQKGETKSPGVSSEAPQGTPLGKKWNAKLSEYLGWDRRPPEEVNQTLIEGFDNGTIKDMRMDKPWVQGQAWGRQHPLTHWVMSKVDLAERAVNHTASKYLYGHKFVEKGFGFEVRPFKANLSSLRNARRAADEGSAMFGWMKLKDPEKKTVLDALIEFDRKGINADDAALQAKGLTPAQINAFKNIRSNAERFWIDEVVPAHEKMRQIDPSIKPLPPMREGWIPHSWHGEFRIYGKNQKTGEEYMVGADSLWEARKAIKHLQSQFPDVTFKEQDISNVRSEHFAKSADAFIDAVKIMGNNSKEGQALLSSFDKFMARRSKFAQHKMPRHEVPIEGYAGSFELGKQRMPGKNFGREKSLVNFERSLESYFNAGARYLHNKQMLQEMEKVTKNEAVMDRFPHALGATQRMLDSYFGVSKALDPMIKDLSQYAGFSSHAPKDAIQAGASYIMYTKVMGLRAAFYIAQALQPSFVLPKMMQLKDMGLSEGSIAIASAKAMGDWMFGGKRKDLAKWAQEQGIIEPRFSEQILLAPDFHGGKANTKDTINTWTGNRLSAGIDMSTRWYALLAFVNMMEANGMKGKQAWEAAARPALDVMVEYEHWKRSPLFREMGIPGNMFSQLTTYLNNSLNRIGEYSAHNQKALVAMTALYFLYSGMTGLPFRQDVDNAIDALNRQNGTDYPNLTDLMIRSTDKKSKVTQDLMLYGLPSAMSGYNFGGSLGSPEILGSLLPSASDPILETGVGTAGGLAAAGKDVLFNATGGSVGRPATDEEKVAGLKAVLPTAPFHGLVENAYSPAARDSGAFLPQNKPVPVPDSKMNFKWERSPEEQKARIFGLRSTDETLADARHYRAKVDEQRDKELKARLVKSAVDSLIRGKGIPKGLYEKYLERGGDPDEWDKALDREEKERTESRRDRILDRADRSDRVDDYVRKHGIDRPERRK